MKTSTFIKFAPIVLALSLIFTSFQMAKAEVIQIERDFQPDPLTLSGTSGGFEKSNCGNIGTTPSQVIEVAESLPYLRLTVESKGKPTLLIDGPEGRFCVLGDSYSQDKPEISGYWQAGKYSLYIGDLSKQQHSYTLLISQQKMPQK
ncbi:hypothetical protein Riv7116_2416 [Rivularia sp. PCC 7116]|uniref:hypothetical protein n=1 Tax=Rivularia sp. PCC 7116 TaxID=373994 RepID=UPI00029F3011|nr:hypothetical protein [Rivularia sp. PCC 7116]AFY54931.1 hypothetical protein Riv7116_2416 [Rivularia sp. PCC 7116]